MAKLCGCDAQAMLKHWLSIASKFSPSEMPGRMVSNRIELERTKAIEKAEKLKARGKAGAAAMWAKQKTDMLKQCLSNAQACSSPSPSPSPSTTPTPSAPLPGLDLVLQKPLSRKEKKKQKLGTFRADTIALIEYLFRKWPTERLGKRIPNDAIKACENVEWIIDTFSDVTIETLRACADGWLTLEHECPNAIQFFFGTGPHAPWRAEVKGLNLPE
jgi:hypothetical protein